MTIYRASSQSYTTEPPIHALAAGVPGRGPVDARSNGFDPRGGHPRENAPKTQRAASPRRGTSIIPVRPYLGVGGSRKATSNIYMKLS
eukprot:6925615-Pyramimonas_sp.AAC.1